MVVVLQEDLDQDAAVMDMYTAIPGMLTVRNSGIRIMEIQDSMERKLSAWGQLVRRQVLLPWYYPQKILVLGLALVAG